MDKHNVIHKDGLLGFPLGHLDFREYLETSRQSAEVWVHVSVHHTIMVNIVSWVSSTAASGRSLRTSK